MNHDADWGHAAHGLIQNLEDRGVTDIAAYNNAALRPVLAGLLINSDEDSSAELCVGERCQIICAYAAGTALKIHKITLAL